jgi:hypothetical protein
MKILYETSSHFACKFFFSLFVRKFSAFVAVVSGLGKTNKSKCNGTCNYMMMEAGQRSRASFYDDFFDKKTRNCDRFLITLSIIQFAVCRFWEEFLGQVCC